MSTHTGLFITFEGTEGSGKSTQIKHAAKYLRKKGEKILHVREPGGTLISEAIREIILNKKFTKMTPQTELLLYLAARAQIVREKILPALRRGQSVICDRFEDSTVAYQGYGRNLSQSSIETVSRLLVREHLIPDLTFLLDIDPTRGMKRGGRHDRMERQSIEFHRKVRQGFLALARKDPKRFVVIDATQSIEEVSKEVEKGLERVI